MKKNLSILLIFISLNSFSQSVAVTADSKWTLGISGSYVSYNNIKAQTGFEHKYIYDKSGFKMGLDIGYRFSKRSSVSTGLYYFKIQYETEYEWHFNQPGDPQIPKKSSVANHYLDIPAIFNFSFLANDKIGIYASAGASASILISDESLTTYEDNSVRESDFLNSFVPGMQFGMGFRYDFDDKTSIKFEPQYRIFLKGFDTLMDQSPTAFYASISLVSKIEWSCFFKNFFKSKAWKPLPSCE